MLQQWLEKAQANEPVWIGDVREELSCSSRSAALTVKLTLLDGKERKLCFAVPDWNTPEERQFITDYVCASIYNLLSATGARKIEYLYDEDSEKLKKLTNEVDIIFNQPSKGYQRILRENRRIVSLCEDDVFSEKPDLNEPLDVHLRRTAAESLKGVRIGIDVGGTDIKCIVTVDGHIASALEYDWNPSLFRSGDEMAGPVMHLAEKLLAETGASGFDGIGLSFPDVIIGNRICGGETPKTMGIRNNPDADYEKEFMKISSLNESLLRFCSSGAGVHAANDGSVAAYTSAVEMAFSDSPGVISRGMISHALGTSLGTGWVDRNGRIPPIPLEFYDSVIDLGSYGSRAYDPHDIRSVISDSSNLQGVDRYLGQASAFRYAYEVNPVLLSGFIEEKDGVIRIRTVPEDMRKPCLENLMRLAENGNKDAEEVFRRVGTAFAQISREVLQYLVPETDIRYVFGRFVKYRHVFELIRDSFSDILPGITLIAADDGMAYSPVMRELAARKDVTVAQFGQAVGAIYMTGE